MVLQMLPANYSFLSSILITFNGTGSFETMHIIFVLKISGESRSERNNLVARNSEFKIPEKRCYFGNFVDYSLEMTNK